MKGFLKMLFLALAVIAFAFWAAITAHADPKTKRVYCIAAVYQRISPCEWVGISNCGNMWKVVIPAQVQQPKSVGVAEGKHAEAWFLDEQNGTWSQLAKVPAIGDTLGYVDVPADK